MSAFFCSHIQVSVFTDIISFMSKESQANFFNEASSHYYYSALFQANAALLSILGVFIIFRLQSLHAIINTSYDYLMKHAGQSDDKIIKKYQCSLSGQAAMHKDIDRGTNHNNAQYRWSEAARKILSFKKFSLISLLYISLVMLTNLFLLSNSNFVYCQGFLVEIALMGICFIMQIFVLLAVVLTILKAFD